MNLKHFVLLIIAVMCFSLNGFSQGSGNVKEQIEAHYYQALRYKEIALYGESIGELDQAIALANKSGFREEAIRASITKSELFRLTENFDRGIKLLYGLKNTKQYPQLHVKKLGRLAALYAENANFSKEVHRDSIKAFVEQGIEISTRLGLKEEEASLRNELGFSQSRNQNFDAASENLNRAKKLFSEIGDEENEMGVSINIFDMYVGMNDFRSADSVYPILAKKIDSTEWYTMKSKLYGIISIRFQVGGDKISELEWAEASHKATVAQARLMNTNQMAAFKVIHDTEQFKNESRQKSSALEQQKSQTERLLLFISVLILIVVIVILIFFRERRLKRKLDSTVSDLNVVNDKYQMLIVESNHRIKNNLQMIISMLEFTKKGLGKSDSEIIQSMSGKIQTISALHKYLYVDVHNEHVDLNVYFREIVRHYKDIGLKYEVNQSICSARIRSERIVYFGLVLNEMLSNTLEHGTSDQLKIELTVEELNGYFSFKYSDGSQHPENPNEGTGTMLIRQLIGRVKGRDYKMFPRDGTYQFNFDTDK